ncbi:MAG: sodium-extruding oxaloacetate decarboxylase subunit alpha [Nitrospirae bacterium]|nr:sodium-extruding oxaloacetate decarboxylase subunit alpha [Nitrospirota bacterium]
MTKPIQITETVLRDAHQSILATRMRTEQMLPIARKLDDIGYWSLEMWGGATFDACIRFLKEDPWQRLKTLRKAIPNTRLQMLLRGQNLVGYRHYADDVVERFVELACDNGIDVFRIFDALNDVRNLETAIRTVKRKGKHAEGAICFTTSPVHTLDTFVEMGRALEAMGCDTIAVKDMAGLITPPQVFELVGALKKAVSLPIHLHSHCTSGVAVGSYMKAVDAGVDIVDTSISSISMGTGQPATESIVAALQGTPHDTGLNLGKLAEIAEYFAGVYSELRDWESGLKGADARMLIYQVPGGMLSNMESQLREQGASDRYEQVLKEVPRVRADLGYIPLVTPTSQIVGTQAVMNVLAGERYKLLSRETEDIVRGMYGQTPAPVDGKLAKRVLKDEQPVTCRPADLIPPELEKHRRDIGDLAESDEDLVTYAIFPQIAKPFFEIRHDPEALKKAIALQQTQKKPSAKGGEWAEPVRKKGNPSDGGDYTVTVNGQTYHVTVAEGHEGAVTVQNIKPAATPAPAPVAAPAPAPSGAGKPVEAPMGGNIYKVACKLGDSVQVGDVVMVLEAMKMEVEVTCAHSGTVQSINAAVGEAVAPGQTLLTIG